MTIVPPPVTYGILVTIMFMIIGILAVIGIFAVIVYVFRPKKANVPKRKRKRMPYN